MLKQGKVLEIISNFYEENKHLYDANKHYKKVEPVNS
ncbi:hypothetical protein OKW21_000977 [Catalinimonas alkaloidigena]|nr:hypothetical protein [Catalinimonas alkaloidigena]